MDVKDAPMALVLGCGQPQLVRQRASYVTMRTSLPTLPPEPDIR